MAEGEIVNTLGFNVDEALQALQRLDTALQTSGTAFGNYGSALDSFNDRAAAALATMRNLASAAGRLSAAMQSAPTVPATPAATQAASSPGFWLPPGMEAETKRLDAALKSAGTAGADAADKIKTGMNDAADQTAKATGHTNKWVVSWETLGRVVMTQAIVRAMSQIRDALREAVAESIDFQRRIAEIQTVAPRLGGSFNQLTSEAAQFAKQFNIPLAQASEGLYQTISDQFTGMSERANVMSAAMKLAKVGVMDFQDATTLITGTLNAFNMTSDQADTVAAKFFTTIKLGHVRGKELADVMGQVIPIASELGINLDEVNAAMVSLTIGGQDAHKSATGLRGAMMALLKPSEDMKKVIRELGFTSAEQLVAAKGLQGALQAVADASDNMASVIGKSVRNVRALTAELRLTQSGAKQVEEAMKAMETSTPDMLEKIYKQFTSTDSEKLTKQINQLKIDLTQDFGSTLTHALGSMMQLVGGSNTLSAAIQAIGFAAIPAGLALGALALAAMTAHLALGPIGWTVMGVTAALSLLVGGMTFTTARSINETRRLADEQHQATLKYIRDKEEELRTLRDTEAKKMAEENRSWENRAAVIRKDYFKALDNLRDKNKEIIESDRQAMQSMVASQERVVAAYRNAANAALRIVQESQNRRVTLEAQASDLIFKDRIDKELKLNDEQKADALLRRSWELEAQANKTLANAQTAEDVQRAQAIQQRAKAYLEEGTALAKQTDNTWLQFQAERSVLSNLQQQVNAEKQLENLQASRAQKLADQAATEQQRLDTMKSLMKAILTDLQAFDKHGAKSPSELAAQQARLSENLGKFQNEWMGGQKVDVADLLAFDQLQRRVTLALEGGVSKAEVSKLFAAPETFASFRADIEKGIGPIQVFINVGRIGGSKQLFEATKGMTAEEAVAHFERELQRSTEIINNFNASRDALKVANVGLEKTQEGVEKSLNRWANVGWEKDLERFGGVWALAHDRLGRFTGIKEAVIQLEAALDKFRQPNAKVGQEDLDLLQKAQEAYIAAVRPGAASKEALEKVITTAAQVVNSADKVEAITKGMDATKGQVEEAMKNKPALENALKAAEEAAKKAKESTDSAKTSAESAGDALSQMSQINMSGLVSQIQDVANAMWDVANASQMSQVGSMMASHGGAAWKFLAGGGPAGTDVIPAMLSPGEVVINAASARRFASQLTAINAGVQPVYRSEGGSVTNIGDINVTVSGGGSSRQTARSIAAELRRELRRGTATL